MPEGSATRQAQGAVAAWMERLAAHPVPPLSPACTAVDADIQAEPGNPLRHRIEPRASPRMAAQDAEECQPEPRPRPVSCDRLMGVLRASRQMTAVAPDERRQGQLVSPDRNQHSPRHDPRGLLPSTLSSLPIEHNGCPVLVFAKLAPETRHATQPAQYPYHHGRPVGRPVSLALRTRRSKDTPYRPAGRRRRGIRERLHGEPPVRAGARHRHERSPALAHRRL